MHILLFVLQNQAVWSLVSNFETFQHTRPLHDFSCVSILLLEFLEVLELLKFLHVNQFLQFLQLLQSLQLLQLHQYLEFLEFLQFLQIFSFFEARLSSESSLMKTEKMKENNNNIQTRKRSLVLRRREK